MRTPPETGRLVRITLDAVPIAIRLRAAERLERKLARELEPLDAVHAAAEIRLAAIRPSRRGYVLSAAAVERVLGSSEK